jgi:hypothetical protein
MRHPLLWATAVVGAVVVACSSGGSDTTGGASSSGASSGGSSGITSSSGGSSGTGGSSGAGSSGASSGNPGIFDFTAKHDGSAPPNGTKVVVLWSVFSGSPDYLYSYGGGQTTGIDVYVSFGGQPPAEALNGGKLGIGLVASLNDGADVAEGKVADWETLVRAVTPMHAVIYRNGTEQVTSKGWDVAFPQGYACGKCIEAEAGFDTFEVDDCANLKLVPVAEDPKFCNFT